MPTRKAKWDTLSQFNFGSTTYTNTELSGIGENAKIVLAAQSNEAGNITYNESADYTVSDPNKIAVDESDNNKVALKVLSGSSFGFPFTDGANYTYDNTKSEFTGVATQLKDLRPANSTFFSGYQSKDGNWGDGVLTGSLNNGATVAGGALDVSGGTGKSCDYVALNNAPIQQKGCVRIGITPNYSGNPSDYQVFWFIGSSGSFTNSIYLFHDTSGPLYVAMYDNVGALIMAHNTGNWNPTASQLYELEVNFDIDLGQTRVFEDGSVRGGTAIQQGTHNAFLIARVGNTYSNALNSDFSVEYFGIFEAVQHTTNYTPDNEAGFPVTIYDTTDTKGETDNGFVFNSALDSLVETATKIDSNLKYQISVDSGVTWEYWDGAIWATITGGQSDAWYYTNEANNESDANLNISTIGSSGTLKIRWFPHSDDGSATPVLDNITVTTTTVYSIEDNLYVDTKDTAQISPANVVEWLSGVVSNTLPTDTDIKILYSVDGRATWLTWSGSGWVAPTSETLRQYATTLLNAGLFFSQLDVGNGTLDARVFLYTSDNSVTPSVGDIEVTSRTGFNASGSYESAQYQPENNTNGVFIDRIDFTVTVPDGATAAVSLRTIENELEEVAGYNEYTDGETVSLCGDFIQWKVDFTSTGDTTPSLEITEVYFHTLIGVMREFNDSFSDKYILPLEGEMRLKEVLGGIVVSKIEISGGIEKVKSLDGEIELKTKIVGDIELKNVIDGELKC